MLEFYVYALIDPRTGLEFYVGKGKGNRIDHHEREARAGKHSVKCRIIREIEAAGLLVVKRRVAFLTDEQDAYDAETDLIRQIGLKNLSNVLPGGQRAWLDREALRASAIAAKEAKQDAKSVNSLKQWLVAASRWPNGCTIPGHRNADEMGAEFIALVRELLKTHDHAHA